MDNTAEKPQPLPKVMEVMERLTENPIFVEARRILDRQSPPWARYHIPDHSEDVLAETLTFAVTDGVEDDQSLELLGMMAISHDVGIALGKALEGHEEKGAAWVREQMATAGYEENDIIVVTQSIEDTRLRKIDGKFGQPEARHSLGRYLLDGDVANFGRDDFEEKGKLVLEELQLLGDKIDPKQFLQNTLALVANHQWQTKAAGRLREAKKQDNIKKLREKLTVPNPE